MTIEPVRPPPQDGGDLLATTTASPPIGHNNPPPFDPVPLAEKEALVASFLDAAGEWMDLGEIETDFQAENLNDFVSGARGLQKQIEDWRVKAKAPHAEAAKAVDDAARPHADKLKRAIDKALVMIGKYSGKKNRAAEAEAEAARLKAKQEVEEAERERLQAIARNDISGEVDAEKAIAESKAKALAAERLAEESGRVRSASGAGRTVATVKIKHARIDNIRLAFLAVQDDPRVVETIQAVLNAKIRAAGFVGDIPGVTIIIEEKAR